MTTMRAILIKPATLAIQAIASIFEPICKSTVPATTHSGANTISGTSATPNDSQNATALSESKEVNARQAHLPVKRRFNKNSPLMIQLQECFRSFQFTPPDRGLLLYVLALLLPITIAIFSTSFDSAEKNLLLNRNISIFLNPAIPDSEAQMMASSLAANEHIRSAAAVQMNIRGNDVMTINIQPAEKLLQGDLDKIVHEFSNHPSVDFVDTDATWLKENQNAINTARSLAWISTIVAAAITAALAFAITSKDLLRHRNHLSVLNQMGASHSTVLRPYFLRGIILVLAALVSVSSTVWVATNVVYHFIDMSTYSEVFPTSLPIGQILSLTFLALSGCTLTGVIFSKKALNA